ncbi:MAG: metabolite traffic protein EboE [Planctomycetota bacterium]
MNDEHPSVTYCGNVHAATDLETWLATLEAYSSPVARGLSRSWPAHREVFGLGVWWPAPLARVLATDAVAQARAREALAGSGLAVVTANAFPFGDFHQSVVKASVYRPDWSQGARVDYTLDVARALCALCPPGSTLPISTLPLGFGGGDVAVMRANLADTARALAEMADASGVRCLLALEPEPFCLVESVAEAIACVEATCLGASDEEVLRRHLGVCVDLCHLAVVGEDPVAAWLRLQRAGVRAPKVQVSSCLEVRDAGSLSRLLAYDEPRYLHQTVGETAHGARVRALDLGEVATRRAEFATCRRVRTHFHVPLFWDEAGGFGSTRDEMATFLRQLGAPWPLLEAETYTWSVLPGFAGDAGALVEGLARELTFLTDCLTLPPGKP